MFKLLKTQFKKHLMPLDHKYVVQQVWKDLVSWSWFINATKLRIQVSATFQSTLVIMAKKQMIL